MGLFGGFSIESLSEDDDDDKLSDSILFLLQSISGTLIEVSSIGLSGFSIVDGSRTVLVKSGRSESFASAEIVKSTISAGDFSLPALVGESMGDNLSSNLLQNVCMLALISGAGFKSFWQSVIVLRKDLNFESRVDALPDFWMLVLGLSPSRYFFFSSRDTLAAIPPVL